MNNIKSNASLVVVGTGIKFLSHLTIEAKAYIEQSNKVLYLVNDPAMKEWIQQKNSNAESLDALYFQSSQRIDSYFTITQHILSCLRQQQHICVVLYGHPTVFSKPALDAVVQARKEGFEAKILPGISSESCLFADLMIDPGSCGAQSFEATDFLISDRKYDSNCHLLLWQVGSIGILDHSMSDNAVKHGKKVLLDHLSKCYPLEHEIVLYEAAQYPFFAPRIKRLPLKSLPDARTSAITTLYVPPVGQSPRNENMLAELGIQPVSLSH